VQESALQALKTAVENFERPAFPCALIAGDVVILHLLEKLDYLSSGKVPVIFIDTFHLFHETHDFMHRLEVSLTFPPLSRANDLRHTLKAHKVQI
jgi:phosphoadenosine phosphosulfate reductase